MLSARLNPDQYLFNDHYLKIHKFAYNSNIFR